MSSRPNFFFDLWEVAGCWEEVGRESRKTMAGNTWKLFSDQKLLAEVEVGQFFCVPNCRCC